MQPTVLDVTLLGLLVVTAGCLSGSPAADPGSTDPRTSPGSPSRAALDDPVHCGDGLWVSFRGLSEPRLWGPSTVRLGTYHPANTSLLYVAVVDGEPAGVRPMTPDGPVHVDGAAIDLEPSLSGHHRVRLEVHRDADGDGRFDAAVDPPCGDADGPVRSVTRVIDFSRFSTGTPDG